VSTPSGDGWFHDLWLPGYVWTDTPDRWTVPGLRATGGSNEWSVENPALTTAVEDLNALETGAGSWIATTTLTPFDALAGRGFPVVTSFVGADGQPAMSTLEPQVVGTALAHVYDTNEVG
jgi:hypothetical protein